MSLKCKQMLQEAGVPALAELHDFVEAIKSEFDAVEELQLRFLQLQPKDRMDFLRDIDPDKARKWSVKVTTAIAKSNPPQQAQQQVFTPLLQQQPAISANRPKEDVPPLKMETKLLFLDKKGQFDGTGYFMTPDLQATYMTHFMGSK